MLVLVCVSVSACGAGLAGDVDSRFLPALLSPDMVVTGTRLYETRLSTVASLSAADKNSVSPLRLGELLDLVPGVFVTEGAKGEAGVGVRGLSDRRITLLFDGVPLHEPYFNTVNLNMVPVSPLHSIRVVKGARSVLYGPNTLGGVVLLATAPVDESFAGFDVSLGEHSTRAMSGETGLRQGPWGILAHASALESDGFAWKQAGNTRRRDNSDVERRDVLGKCVFRHPDGHEVFAECLYTRADYGVPPATDIAFPRYWRFRDWERLLVSAGAACDFEERGAVRATSYVVRHDNVLEAYTDDTYQVRRWVSTYENPSAGGRLLYTLPRPERHLFQFSLNAREDRVKQQPAEGADWESFEQWTVSGAAEHTIELGGGWRTMAGLSSDYLDKDNGTSDTALNGVAGVAYSVRPRTAIKATASRASRFPTMRSLYNSRDGNPDLREERATGFELGLTREGTVRWQASVFHTSIDDMIVAVRDGNGDWSRVNIGEARVLGAELDLAMQTRLLLFGVYGVVMDTENRDTGRPLDNVPDVQVGARLRTTPWHGISGMVWGRSASSTTEQVGGEERRLPRYAVVDAQVQKQFGRAVVYARVDNLTDSTYETQAGYPAPARTFRFGTRFQF